VKNRPFRERLGFAAEGLKSGWLRERSFRTQSVFALMAVAALILLRPAPIWWAIVALVAAMVLALELLNSALEGVIDLLHPGIHPEIKVVKDMLAGAVLIVSLSALIVAAALVVSLW
jgi:diacylglycerol kinase (ATP)